MTSALMAWFKTDLPIHVCALINHWYPLPAWPVSTATFTREEWVAWAAINLPPLLGDLLGCPYCLSWHISFWFSWLLLGQLPYQVIILCFLSWPTLSNLLLPLL